ncbi:MAG TPA: DUF2254 domain-containing protein [Tepidisphaeraceae bacterium]|jgi:uncharacterized membrane protein|nr:DUF2254 domain-containing protein [Tepidisphaeraceae bacterium]
MHTRVRHVIETLSSSYWFVPTLMVVAGAGGAIAMLYVDRSMLNSREPQGWLYGGGAEGANTLLSTVAGSIVTVAGVVFSITIAALSQASSQFGPRLLRNFMRDRGNQVVLGTFVATFVYCLLILRTVRRDTEDGSAFIPHAAITVAVLLAVLSIGVLVYFIHHVSVSLQAPMVVAQTRAELEAVVARLGDEMGVAGAVAMAPGHDTRPSDFHATAKPIVSHVSGYVQAVDYDGLLHAATELGLTLELKCRPGNYVIECNAMLIVWPAERCTEAVQDRLRNAFICGRHSTPEQDIEYGVRQIVEIAVRALSPGINDPFTAINCIDALGSAICRVGQHGLPGPLRYDAKGILRIVAPVTTFDGLVDMAFNQIRQYGRTSVPVTLRLLEVITEAAEQLTGLEERAVLLRHAEMIHREGETKFTEPSDLTDLNRRWAAATAALGRPGEEGQA